MKITSKQLKYAYSCLPDFYTWADPIFKVPLQIKASVFEELNIVGMSSLPPTLLFQKDFDEMDWVLFGVEDGFRRVTLLEWKS